jgi:hypothetical protein
MGAAPSSKTMTVFQLAQIHRLAYLHVFYMTGPTQGRKEKTQAGRVRYPQQRVCSHCSVLLPEQVVAGLKALLSAGTPAAGVSDSVSYSTALAFVEALARTQDNNGDTPSVRSLSHLSHAIYSLSLRTLTSRQCHGRHFAGKTAWSLI